MLREVRVDAFQLALFFDQRAALNQFVEDRRGQLRRIQHRLGLRFGRRLLYLILFEERFDEHPPRVLRELARVPRRDERHGAVPFQVVARHRDGYSSCRRRRVRM